MAWLIGMSLVVAAGALLLSAVAIWRYVERLPREDLRLTLVEAIMAWRRPPLPLGQGGEGKGEGDR
jgi:hypothetical protein